MLIGFYLKLRQFQKPHSTIQATFVRSQAEVMPPTHDKVGRFGTLGDSLKLAGGGGMVQPNSKRDTYFCIGSPRDNALDFSQNDSCSWRLLSISKTMPCSPVRTAKRAASAAAPCSQSMKYRSDKTTVKRAYSEILQRTCASFSCCRSCLFISFKVASLTAFLCPSSSRPSSKRTVVSRCLISY